MKYLWLVGLFLVYIYLILSPPLDISEEDLCKYTWRVTGEQVPYDSFTNNKPNLNGCIHTTTGNYCGNFSFKETIKNRKECLPVGSDGKYITKEDTWK